MAGKPQKCKNGRSKLTCYVQIYDVPVALRNQFSAWCTLHGVTMREKMISLMREVVKQP